MSENNLNQYEGGTGGSGGSGGKEKNCGRKNSSRTPYDYTWETDG